MRVVELGAGLGILTRELCAVAKSVLAVEIDGVLYEHLRNSFHSDNLTLVHKDFFDMPAGDFEGVDLLVSNAPYSLSSKTVLWVCEHRIPAVLCLQKEFVEHMMAKPGTHNYSRLSVLSALQIEMEYVRDVGAGNFYPRPKVDSCVIRLNPAGSVDKRTAGIIGILMSQKKKTMKSAILASVKPLGISKDRARELSDAIADRNERVFKLSPSALLSIATKIGKELST